MTALVDAMVGIILPCINVSNQHARHLNLYNVICQVYLNKTRGKKQANKISQQNTEIA